MTTQTLTLDDIPNLHLDKGAHDSPDEGMCVMEATALLAGEGMTDSPACASPVIATFLRTWNDQLPDDDRQQLKRYIPLLIGTAGSPELEGRRAWMALDWLVRTYTPAWLRCAGLTDQADALAGLPEFADGMDVPSVRPTLEAVRRDATAAGSAAGYAAWSAARSAAERAAGSAARSAAWSAARCAAWSAARCAAWSAAWSAAGSAAESAARSAAGCALRPTVVELQQSAHDLIDRMIEAS